MQRDAFTDQLMAVLVPAAPQHATFPELHADAGGAPTTLRGEPWGGHEARGATYKQKATFCQEIKPTAIVRSRFERDY